MKTYFNLLKQAVYVAINVASSKKAGVNVLFLVLFLLGGTTLVGGSFYLIGKKNSQVDKGDTSELEEKNSQVDKGDTSELEEKDYQDDAGTYEVEESADQDEDTYDLEESADQDEDTYDLERSAYTVERYIHKTEKDTCKNHCKDISMKIYNLGYSHALRGWRIKVFNRTVNKCASYGITLSRSDYYKGWNDGVHVFCTYERGYRFGLYGGQYLKICSTGNESDFLRGYHLGVRKYKRKKWKLSLEERKVRWERELFEIEKRAYWKRKRLERERQARRARELLEREEKVRRTQRRLKAEEKRQKREQEEQARLERKRQAQMEQERLEKEEQARQAKMERERFERERKRLEREKERREQREQKTKKTSQAWDNLML